LAVRRIGFAVLALASLLPACGRQVTPDLPGVGPGGLSKGYMSVKFDVSAPMKFSNYQYIVAFDTAGSGITPGTNTPASYNGYSFSIVAGGANGGTYATVNEYVRTPGQPQSSAPTLYQLQPTNIQLQYVPNSNGAYTEFTVTFARVIFDGIKPTGSATPPPVAATWAFNAFTGQQNAVNTWVYIDSMGAGGGNSSGPQWPSPPLNVAQPFDTVFFGRNGTAISDPSAQIVSVEIANNP
jgi:hypothetical protein